MRFTSTLSVCQHFRSEHKLPTMTGFTELPYIYALGSSFIKEHNGLRARYSFIHHRQNRVGSSLVEILKALLHKIWGSSEGKEEW